MTLLNSKLGSDSMIDVAQTSGMSLRNFNRLFLNSNQTITDIAFEVGFNSVSKFIEAFKKIEGKLPSDFRQQNV